jgi:hypothetical protein
MKMGGWLTERKIGGCLVLILAAPTAKAAAMPRQDEATVRQEQSALYSGAQEIAAESGGGMPTVNSARSDATLPDAPEVAQSQSPRSKEQDGSSQPGRDQQQNGGVQPVGTAAAPSVTRTGVTAAKPAGAAIAPAKQRRVRIILISLGVVAAACAAVGTVAGLSHTSPSQPK